MENGWLVLIEAYKVVEISEKDSRFHWVLCENQKRKSSKYPDEFNCKIFSHWILLGTKNINGVRYSSPWVANEQNGLTIAFGCTDS